MAAAPPPGDARDSGVTVFADTPRWPRHGLVWGHLISDSSLEELHEAAHRAGLHPRSFDLDHYDWPEQAREQLRAAGVCFVGNRELARILVASGMRVPAAQRPAARRARTERAARALGLEPAPLDLVTGTIGHADPLPPRAGAFRVTVESPAVPARIEAHDEAGRAAAGAFLARVDALSRRATGEPWVGQAVDG